MPPPASYLDITSLPFTHTITVAEFNAGTYGGVANQIWFRFVSTGDQILAASTNSSGAYATFKCELYKADGSSLVISATGDRNPWWFYLDTQTFYLKCVLTTPGPIASDIAVRVESGLIASLPLPAGAIIINDDSIIQVGGVKPHSGEPFPATAWDLDGTFLGFIPGIPAGEIGDVLSTGHSLWHIEDGGSDGSRFALYNSSWSLLSIFDTSPAFGSTRPAITHDDDQFYIINRSTKAVWSVTSTGTVTAVATLSGAVGTVGGVGVSPDGATLYYSIHAGGTFSTIYRHDISTDSPLSAFYVVPVLSGGATGWIALTAVNNHPGEILALSDGTVVTWYTNFTATPDQYVLLHLSSGGTLINSYTYTDPTGLIDHISVAPDSPSGIHIWFFTSSTAQTGRVGHLILATGVLDEFFDTRLYSSGVTLAGGTPDDALFGPSSSCTMVTASEGPEEPEEPIDPSPIDASTPCPCPSGPGGGGPIDTIPDPIGPLPPWVAMCEGGCGVDSVADVTVGEVWL